jgi:SAM-dependent methyltransferase
MRKHDFSTTTDANRAQSAAWNGPEGASWARHSARRHPRGDLVAPLLDAAAIEPHETVLDIGCGTGEMTRRAARAAFAGQAVGVDLSRSMVDLATRVAREQGLTNVTFERCDAQIHAFAADAFDLAVSHFGMMFFADPLAAFTNIARALRPGGRLAFVCPQAMERCDWYRVPLMALTGHRPTPHDAPSAMFSLANPTTIDALLTEADFTAVDIRPLDRALWFGVDAEAAAEAFLGSGPVRAVLEDDPTLTPRAARRRLVDAVAPFQEADGIRIPGAHWLVQAHLTGVAR